MKVSVIGQSHDSDSLISVFLHGFPALRSKQNREIAEFAAHELERETHLLLYSGLSQAPGTFSFQKCLTDVGNYFEELIAKRPKVKIDIVGHSWGGYLSLQMATRFASNIRRMVLMSPLLVFPAAELGARAMHEYAAENPALSLGDPEKLAVDFHDVGTGRPAADMIPSVSPLIEILFLQARNDDITLTKFALEFVERFQRRPTFELVDTDHSFVVDRPQLSKRITQFLK